MACWSPARRLTRVDLPTLGRPITATIGSMGIKNYKSKNLKNRKVSSVILAISRRSFLTPLSRAGFSWLSRRKVEISISFTTNTDQPEDCSSDPRSGCLRHR
jgi:hypothetical protein